MIAIFSVQYVRGLLYKGNYPLLAHLRGAEYLGFSHSYLRFINTGLDFTCLLLKNIITSNGGHKYHYCVTILMSVQIKREITDRKNVRVPKIMLDALDVDVGDVLQYVYEDGRVVVTKYGAEATS